MTIKAIVFDKDGVLVDFDATFGPATNVVLDRLCNGDIKAKQRAAEIMQYDIATSRFDETSFLIAGTAMDMAEKTGGVFRRSDVASFGAEIDLLYGEVCVDMVVPVAGVGEALDQLSQMALVLGIATNDAEANARSQMERLALESRFASIFGADSGHGAKPGPGMIQAFMQTHALTPDQVLMVGDSTHDMEAGHAAGVMTVAVESGPATYAAFAPFARAVLPSIAHLPQWLANGSSV